MQEDGSVDKRKEEGKVEGKRRHRNTEQRWGSCRPGSQVHLRRAGEVAIPTERGREREDCGGEEAEDTDTAAGAVNQVTIE